MLKNDEHSQRIASFLIEMRRFPDLTLDYFDF